ncbi:MAG: undecaprenyl/decaprenyl-phosphate alpha-N-acetylglucosaminyl 1-phosphate transferase [Thermoleophilaceae bacterium]|nr:undecaprenyl/decaprenyl-phosphate alpha-N-acetylglucosaminyl 1-phosphate transferase [Thermoleophilaceae bacterium]
MSVELKAAVAFAVATALAFAFTPLAARIAHRVGAVAEVGERSLHQKAMPSLGGLAILIGVLVPALIFLPVNDQVAAILIGAITITTVGALDDIFDLHPAIKLAGQTGAAAIPVYSGVVVTNVTLPFIEPFSLGAMAEPLTLLGIVAVVNVVNFTDGVDGLAAGVCVIAAVTLSIIALSLDRSEAGILAACTAGAAFGFLFHNFHPASIFMGDAGSNLLGYLLACIAIQGVLKTAAVVALVFPLVILAVPILDTGFVVAKRLKYGKPVYQADTWHFHHRFVNIGFSQRRTVAYLYAWTSVLACLALALRFVPYSDGHGNFNTGWTLVMLAIGLAVVAASFYLVIVLEILKLRRFSGRAARRQGNDLAAADPIPAEVDAQVAHVLETGEFPAVPRD